MMSNVYYDTLMSSDDILNLSGAFVENSAFNKGYFCDQNRVGTRHAFMI